MPHGVLKAKLLMRLKNGVVAVDPQADQVERAMLQDALQSVRTEASESCAIW
jgi:hypothetical protein